MKSNCCNATIWISIETPICSKCGNKTKEKEPEMSVLDEFELKIKKKSKEFLDTVNDVTEFIVGKKSSYKKPKPKPKKTYKRRSKK
tara:strand:+ start:1625 stop:1882 length:258 start_codon:yes stop_codon:yes gene_type:complete